LDEVPQIGRVLGERYRVLETLGSGGMGVVFRADNIVTGKQVAIKWLYPRAGSNGQTDGRPLREARVASCLRHPNVVDVYDILPDGTTSILVMELLVGETLRTYLKRSPRIDVAELLALLLPAMDGVAAAHASGVIHRDLKPDNIFLETVPGRSSVIVKVLDFGIAKRTDDIEHTLTETGKALGTPSYMSLEQLRGDRDIDARADVYALGVMLYEAITGQMPHDASSLPELAIKRATVAVPSVKELRPELPTSLARIVDWAIARDRDERVPDVRTLRDELELFAREHSFRGQMTQRDSVLPLIAAPRESRPSPSPRPRDAARVSPPASSAARARRTSSTSLVLEILAARAPGTRERAAWMTLVLALLVFAGGLLWRDRSAADRSPPHVLPMSRAVMTRHSEPSWAELEPSRKHAVVLVQPPRAADAAAPVPSANMSIEAPNEIGSAERGTLPVVARASAKKFPNASGTKRADAGGRPLQSVHAAVGDHPQSKKTIAEMLAF
jgi:serine/threonine-protein kinase